MTSDLAEYFAAMARRTLEARTTSDTLALLAVTAVEVVPGCDHCSISVLVGRELRSESSNDEIGPVLDRLQTEEQEGPCMDAIKQGEVQISPHLAVDARWRRYGPRVCETTPVQSSMAAPLTDGRSTIGALNLFGNELEAFSGAGGDDPSAVALVGMLCAHASAALSAARQRDQLEEALRSRDVIGQAKGMLMVRRELSEAEAFRALSTASQRQNEKLAVVASRVVEAGGFLAT